MDIIKEADFRRMIKKELASGYLFFGEEDYTKSHALSLLRRTVCGEEDNDLCGVKISFLDYTPEKLIDAIIPLPMFGTRRLVELSGFDFGAMKREDIDALCEVLALLPDYDYNTLVIPVSDGNINEGQLPRKPSEMLRTLGEHLVPVRFERSAPSQLAAWAAKHFAHNGVSAPPEICSEIVSYCGRNMYKLAGEIDKVSFYVLAAGRREVGADDITAAAIPENEYDAFAFANALTSADRARALSVLSLMAARRVEPVMIMSEVSRVFCDLLAVRTLADEGLRPRDISEKLRMHEYRTGLYLSAVSKTSASVLSEILGKCAAADTALKSSYSGYSAIELFICSI